MPVNGGRSWTIASPATTSASDVRCQAKKVRSLAKVNLASGSVSVSVGSWPGPAGSLAGGLFAPGRDGSPADCVTPLQLSRCVRRLVRAGLAVQLLRCPF